VTKRIVKWKNEDNSIAITGNVYYLNESSGNDSNNGSCVSQAFLTQAHGESILNNGDILIPVSVGEGEFPKAGKANFTSYKLNDIIYNPSVQSSQIIADHTIVDDYAKIPDEYITEVKKMLVNILGESHGRGYHYGLQLLENIDSRFTVNITWYGQPESYSADHLRSVRTWRNGSSWYYTGGEENWYTNTTGIAAIKGHLNYMRNTLSNPVSVILFGWCYDMTWHNSAGGTMDPVYYVHWAGSTEGGPDGDVRWGLDSGDQSLTGNSVCMDTYLDATEQYIAYDSQTKTVFTTGPMEAAGSENGYQRYLKHEYIRNYVKADSSRILFDYADIISYNDSDELNTESWTDGNDELQTFPLIHADNLGTYDGGEGNCHISQAGCLRLGKALWWMLARIAGWDGN
jgi:hypothetical protein